MEDEKTFKIILAISLIGVLSLLILVKTLEIPLTNIGNLTESNIDKTAKVQGNISSITETQGLYLINLKDATGKLTIVVFKNKQDLNLKKRQAIEVQGKVIEYKGELEIQASVINLK